MTNPLPLRDAVADAVSSVGLIVTKWILIAEVFTTDGEKELMQCAPEDLTSWDAIGMLQFSANEEPGDNG